jgi:hypothetical protein
VDWIPAILVGFVLLFIVFVVAGVKRNKMNQEAFDNRLKELKNNDCKISYANKSTGTIGWRDDKGNYHSESVFRGYNSHHR